MSYPNLEIREPVIEHLSVEEKTQQKLAALQQEIENRQPRG